jgi:hypothetical protein
LGPIFKKMERNVLTLHFHALQLNISDMLSNSLEWLSLCKDGSYRKLDRSGQPILRMLDPFLPIDLP